MSESEKSGVILAVGSPGVEGVLVVDSSGKLVGRVALVDFGLGVAYQWQEDGSIKRLEGVSASPLGASSSSSISREAQEWGPGSRRLLSASESLEDRLRSSLRRAMQYAGEFGESAAGGDIRGLDPEWDAFGKEVDALLSQEGGLRS